MAKIAQLTAKYIAEHPTAREGLSAGIVNYSKLARQISSHIGTAKFSAVLAACRRYAASMAREETGLDILRKSRKTVKIAESKAQITFTISEKSLAKVLADTR